MSRCYLLQVPAGISPSSGQAPKGSQYQENPKTIFNISDNSNSDHDLQIKHLRYRSDYIPPPIARAKNIKQNLIQENNSARNKIQEFEENKYKKNIKKQLSCVQPMLKEDKYKENSQLNANQEYQIKLNNEKAIKNATKQFKNQLNYFEQPIMEEGIKMENSAIWVMNKNQQIYQKRFEAPPVQSRQSSVAYAIENTNHQNSHKKESLTFESLLKEKSRENSVELYSKTTNKFQYEVIQQQINQLMSTRNQVKDISRKQSNQSVSQIDNESKSKNNFLVQNSIKQARGIPTIQGIYPSRDLSQESQQNSLSSSRRKKSILNVTHNSSIASGRKINTQLECSQDSSPQNQRKGGQIELCCEEDILITEEQDCQIEQPGVFNQETLQYLMIREIEYAPDPYYLENKQPQLDRKMRAVLMDWMMEVSMEFNLKRETYTLSVGYVDRYLSRTKCLSKVKFQLLGVTALFIAAKMEVMINSISNRIDIQEVNPPRITQYEQATASSYSVQQINDMELSIYKELKWNLNPPTSNLWLNWYVGQWDLYINKLNEQMHPFRRIYQKCVYFKQADLNSYTVYQQLTQLYDCAMLDIQSLQFKTRILLASFMYLILTLNYQIFNLKQIQEDICQSSGFLLDDSNLFNSFFGEFVQFTFGFNLVDLLPSIQYASTFFILSFQDHFPVQISSRNGEQDYDNYEEFLSCQTHNQFNLQCILKRWRKKTD